MNKLLQYCKDNIWSLLGFVFNPIAPLIYFGTLVSLYQTNITFRITVWGYIILCIIGLIVLLRLNGKFKKMKHSLKRGLLLSILPAIIWLAGFGLVYGIDALGDSAMEYWLVCGLFFICSRFCYCMHEVKHTEEQ